MVYTMDVVILSTSMGWAVPWVLLFLVPPWDGLSHGCSYSYYHHVMVLAMGVVILSTSMGWSIPWM